MISLAVLGLISALTLPTIINNVQTAQRKALFKETLHMISTATQADFMENGTQNGWHTMLKNRTPWEVSCESTTDTRCNLTSDLIYINGASHGLRYPNGVRIKFQTNAPNTYVYMYMDVNGSNPPNLDGQDQMAVCVNLTTTSFGVPGQYTSHNWARGLRPGEVRPCENHNGVSRIYDWIWR